MQRWSVKDYNNVDYSSDKLFFESFNKFGSTVIPTIQKGLIEIKNRALKENVSYIETQLTDIPCSINSIGFNNYNAVLRRLAAGKDEQHIFQMLDTLSTALIKQGALAPVGVPPLNSNKLQIKIPPSGLRPTGVSTHTSIT